jgi:hypothetical protein
MPPGNNQAEVNVKIFNVTVQIRAPKEGDVGQVAEGRYTLEDDVVTLVSHAGVPVRGPSGETYSKKLEDGEAAHVIAGRLTKAFRRARLGDKHRVEGFSSPISYPKNGSII